MYVHCGRDVVLFFASADNHGSSGAPQQQGNGTDCQSLENPDTLIIGYQEYVQDLPFYTKSRVALYDCYDELKFGSEHESGRGWFWDKETLLNTWNSRDNIILVVPQKKREDCLKTMNLDLTKFRHREFERYIVIMK